MPVKKATTTRKTTKTDEEKPVKVPTMEEFIGSPRSAQAEAGTPVKAKVHVEPAGGPLNQANDEPAHQAIIPPVVELVTEKQQETAVTPPLQGERVEATATQPVQPSAAPQSSYQPRQYTNYNRYNDYKNYNRPSPRQFQNRGYDRAARTFEDQGPTEEVKGYLDIQPEGHGFLRPKFTPSSKDVYISQSQIRRFSLRGGDFVTGMARPPKDTERYFGLLKVEKVNESSAEESLKRPHFDDLTAMYPKKQITLTTGAKPLSTRMIDLIAPIGFGQRGMIVSPPKAGKTTIIKEIAAGITANFPQVHLMAALIGERPEEVTDIAMSVKGDVIASNFDDAPESQTRVAEITIERAKRLVEMGKDVIILLDSVTRLARAYNLAIEPSGRTLSGGFDPAALFPAKKFFGAARNCQEGGSLTIIGTALTDTGSRMDDLIFEEFKGTGNMELHLDRRLADRRIFPSINVERSSTRQEELILPEDVYKKVVTMRRMIDMLGPEERTAIVIERLMKTETNADFLDSLGKGI